MTDLRATFGHTEVATQGNQPLYLVLRARHATQMPVCHRCIIERAPRVRRCRRRLSWLAAPLAAAVFIVFVMPDGARAALNSMLGSPSRPSIDISSALFPQAVPGYDQELGLTLPSAPESDDAQAGRGVRAAGVLVQPALDLGTAYDSNVLGARGRPGSIVLTQTPSVSLTTEGSVVRVGAFLDIENSTYVNQPRQSRTDFKAAIGATADLGKASVTLGYSHLHLHDDPSAIGSIASSEPTPFDVDDLRLSGSVELGRLSLLPFLDYSHWSYGRVRIGGIQTDESFRDRDLIQAGTAARLMVGERRDLLASVSFVSTQYNKSFGALPAPSSNGVLALAGVDYEIDSALKLRLLAGLQARAYSSGFYRNQVVAVGQLAIDWLPQKQTDVTLSISRSLEDLSQEDPGGTIFTRAELAVRHEFWRNLILRARTGVTSAEFLQAGGTQATGYLGGGFDWELNRHWRLVGDAQVSRVSSPVRNFNPAGSSSLGGPYTRVQTGLHLVTAL